MNTENYASLEASKRLADVGIALETDSAWFRIYHPADNSYEWKLLPRAGQTSPCLLYDNTFPAPSMAEAGRELPEGTCLQRGITDTYAWIKNQWCDSLQSDANPADALIYLLIWVTQQKDIIARKDYDYEKNRD